MNSFDNDLFTFDNFLSARDSVNNSPTPKKAATVGHFSLFSGYQELNGQKTDFSIDEIKSKQKLYVSESKSSRRAPTPPSKAFFFNLSNLEVPNNLPPVTRLVLVEDIISKAIPKNAPKQLLNIKVIILSNDKHIKKLKEKQRTLLKKVSSPTKRDMVKKTIKKEIKKVQEKTSKEISKVSSPNTKQRLEKAQELIKKIQKQPLVSSPSSSPVSSPKSSPVSSPKVAPPPAPKASPPKSEEDPNELLRKINKQLMELQTEVEQKIKKVNK
jgi:hypothetical protein